MRTLQSFTNKTCFSARVVVAILQKNWFMLLAVRISSNGCTWEVWRPLKKLDLLSAAPRYVTRSNQIRKRLLKHKLRTPQIFFEHTIFSLKFPAYIAVHKLAVTNSTKHVTHPTHFPTKNESVLNTTKLFIRVLGNYTVNVA